MSTSVTQGDWQIVIYDQLELHTRLRWWSVAVWVDFDRLAPIAGEIRGKARCLWEKDNFDWDKYELTSDTLESLVAEATEFIKGEQK